MKSRTDLTIPLSPKQMFYMCELVKMEGFGDSPGDVARQFIWDRINQLIESGRLKERL
jgi:hypothetical protein